MWMLSNTSPGKISYVIDKLSLSPFWISRVDCDCFHWYSCSLAELSWWSPLFFCWNLWNSIWMYFLFYFHSSCDTFLYILSLHFHLQWVNDLPARVCLMWIEDTAKELEKIKDWKCKKKTYRQKWIVKDATWHTIFLIFFFFQHRAVLVFLKLFWLNLLFIDIFIL